MRWPWRARLSFKPIHRKKSSQSLLHTVVMEAEGSTLLGNERGSQLHPRLWMFLGCSFVVIGLVNVVLAALWHFWLGVALGFGVAKMGTSLCGMTLAARPPPPPARGCFGWLKNLGRRMLMWGASKMQQLFYFFRWAIYLYGLVVLLQVVIHMASPDYRWATFPNECPEDKLLGCSRIAESNPHNARHLQPLHLNAQLDTVQSWAKAWVQAQAQATLLRDSRRGFLHARCLSVFWGFADDMFISIRCDKQRRAVVEVQSQLRLGRSDFSANGRRNERFMLELSRAVQEGQLPEGECVEGYAAAGGGATIG